MKNSDKLTSVVFIFLASFSILLSINPDAQAIPPAPVITTPSQTTNNATPTIQGTAQGLSNVKLFDGATQIGSTTATGGSLTFSITNNVVGSAANAVVVSDFNNDGKQDIAVARSVSGTGQVSVKLGTGTGTFGATTNFGVGSQPNSIAAGDFNGDGNQDLATGNINSNNISILLGTGTGSFTTGTAIPGTGAHTIAVGDFNGDGKKDLAVGYGGRQSIPIYLGTGTGTFTYNGDFGSGLNGVFSIVVGDFNADGKQDLASANGNNKISVFLGNGAGGFSFTSFNAGSDPRSIAVGDFNGDGKQDLVNANNGNPGSNNVSVFLGTGTGTFGAATFFATGTNPISVVVGDFNGDGKKDLAVAVNGGSKVNILLGTGTGSFTGPNNFSVGMSFGDPRQIALGDFNGDGRQDLVTANFDGGTANGNFSILLNTVVSPWSIVSSTLSDGAHSIRATATDGTGTSPNSNIITITVDTTPPNTTITSNPPSITNSASASFSFTSTEPGTFECQIDASPYSLCTSPKSYSSLSDGTHTFNVRAKDSLGNTDPTPATYTWTVDTIAPSIDSVLVSPDILGSTAQLTITKTASDVVGVTSVSVILQGPSPSTGTVGTPLSLSLTDGNAQSGTWTGVFTFPSQDEAPDGTYTVLDTATDAAGNSNEVQDGSIVLDRTSPTLSILSIIPNKQNPDETVTVTASTSDNTSGISEITAQDLATGEIPVPMTFVSGSADPGMSSTWERIITASLPEGSHSVEVVAKDNAVPPNANTLTGEFIVDATAPTVSVPADITEEATSSAGAVVSFTATADDDVDGSLTPTCDPLSDTTFGLGTTQVTCSATDAAGNSGFASFNIIIVDTIAPTIDSHADVTEEATSSSGAEVTYTLPATHDIVDGDGTATCNPVSGSTFALGDTTVTCDASDAAGNPAVSTTFTVHVVDTIAPTIDSHADVTEEATSSSGAAVTYTLPATHDIVDGDGTATCNPVSGSTFALGDTTVTCDATDAAGNPAVSTTFTVHVIEPTTPTTTILQSNMDSFLRSGNDNTNEGANPNMVVRASGDNRALVSFDTSSVSGTISSATLRLFVVHNGENWGETGRVIGAHYVTQAWQEGNGANMQPGNLNNAAFNPLQTRGNGPGVTWRCAVDSEISNQKTDCTTKWNGGTFVATPTDIVSIFKDFDPTDPNKIPTQSTINEWIEFDVTADLNSCLGGNCSWMIKKVLEGQNGRVEFATKEGAAAIYDAQYSESVAPQLRLNFGGP